MIKKYVVFTESFLKLFKLIKTIDVILIKSELSKFFIK